MTKLIINIIIILSALLLLWACASQNATKPADKANILVSPDGESPSQIQKLQPWERLLEDVKTRAKKEGTVSILSASGPQLREGLAPRFYQKFGVQIEFVTAKGSQLAEKITTERRVGIYTADLYMGGSTTMITDLKPKGFLDPIESFLLLPEVLDKKVWLKGDLHFLDKDRLVLAFTAYPNAPLGVNTNLVKLADVKSYKNLLDPRWEGKLLMNDPTTAGTGAKWFGVVGSMTMGWDFLRQLARQKPTIIRDMRIQLEWLAQGKYPILIVPHSPTMNEFQNAGAPVTNHTPEEGAYLTAGSGNVVFMNKAPHPNASKLFVNWLLTKEAGELWQKAMGQQSARLDVPSSLLDPQQIRQSGVKYVDADNEAFLMAQPEQMKLAQEIFGPLIK